ncbi:MAG: NADH-quinone oxidoreductase subunit B [Actinobacteria bacterium]|nr:NADH-quinone oxidoreductase subunit B [Actinomycetota bacterium]
MAQGGLEVGLIHRAQHPNVITTSLDQVINWARAHSLWWLGYGIACCAIEGLMSASMSRYDFDRFGVIFRESPRQADFMIVAGPVPKKMEPVIKRLYDQMAEPRWVMAMGSCAISGGGFAESYHVLKGVDSILPVDVYVPGCPPRPEALYYGVFQLRKKIMTETFVGGGKREPIIVPAELTKEMEREIEAELLASEENVKQLEAGHAGGKALVKEEEGETDEKA